MEHLLRHLAEQLDSLDKVSLMRLRDKYALRAEDFVPTRDWELDVLVYCLIEAKHMKDQLYKQCLARRDKLPSTSRRRGQAPVDVSGRRRNGSGLGVSPETARKRKLLRESMGQQDGADTERKPGVVLHFNPDAGRK